jgi:holo-[acyl-carrier protein] synthase
MLDDLGVGVDIEDVDRFKLDRNKDNAFLKRIFTKNELDYCYARKSCHQHLAARFAGKEAIIKALNNIQKKSIQHNMIEIMNNSSGVPEAHAGKYRIRLSLSHDSTKAIAFAIVEK